MNYSGKRSSKRSAFMKTVWNSLKSVTHSELTFSNYIPSEWRSSSRNKLLSASLDKKFKLKEHSVPEALPEACP